jgi:DNA polymerase III delta subunit
MIIFLYGQDSFRLARKLRQIVDAYRQKTKGLNFIVVDASEASFEDFYSSIFQTSLFEEKKLAVVHNALDKSFKEKLEKTVKELAKSEHNIILCQEGKVLKTDKLLSLLKKSAEVQEFESLEGAKLTAWIESEFLQLGKAIDKPAAAALGERLGGDLWQLANEIQKLAHSFEGTISQKDVEAAFKYQAELNIFKTIDALAQKDKPGALRLIHQHIDSGDHPLYLLAMVANQLRNLIGVKSYLETEGGGYGDPGAASRLGMHPFVFSKTVRQSRLFNLDSLKEIFYKLMKYDVAIKSGRIDPGVALDLIIGEI